MSMRSKVFSGFSGAGLPSLAMTSSSGWGAWESGRKGGGATIISYYHVTFRTTSSFVERKCLPGAGRASEPCSCRAMSAKAFLVVYLLCYVYSVLSQRSPDWEEGEGEGRTVNRTYCAALINDTAPDYGRCELCVGEKRGANTNF